MELKQHPLSAAFPAMSAEDFQALKDDIEVNGQREPVMLFEGMVLDGWHRYRACVDLGIKPQQFTFGDDDPVAFVKSQNLHRRHLTGSQRTAAIVACAEWHPPHRTKKVEATATFPKTNKEIAKEAGVSVRTVTDTKTAKKAGLLDAVRDGALTATEAANVSRGTPVKAPAPKPKRMLDNRSADVAALTEDDKLTEAQHTITELAAENEQLQDRLAVEAMDASEHEKTRASETIRELRALVKTLEAENAVLKVSRDTYQREATEAKKSAIYWRKQAEKAAKDPA